jgi:hypothetical protein
MAHHDGVALLKRFLACPAGQLLERNTATFLLGPLTAIRGRPAHARNSSCLSSSSLTSPYGYSRFSYGGCRILKATAKLRRPGSVRGVLGTWLLHKGSGAGFWTLRQEVAGHQRPCPLIGGYWRSAACSARRPGHQGPRSPDMGGRHTCLRQQGERLQGAGWDIIRTLEGHKLCGKAADGLWGTDGRGLATQRAHALSVLLQAASVPGWGSPPIAACVTHPNTLRVRSPNSLFRTRRLLYPFCALVPLVCSSISQLWFA